MLSTGCSKHIYTLVRSPWLRLDAAKWAGVPVATYREDIDRLRGLAVLSVVAFHFEAVGVHGGYVGVDIFFVISGFLITQIIQREMRAGTFSFASFYERRVRRLLPALYVVVAAIILPAFYFLLPSERVGFFRSIGAAVTFTSNIFFWSQSGYFDRTAVEKPLLHIWSLAVEEQFYLFFPALIWAAIRFGRGRVILPAVLIVLLAASFGAGLWLLQSGHPATAFYMSPVRAWEFLIGSVVAADGFPSPKHRIQRLAAIGGAYVLMLVPIFGLRTISPFPGWNALAPCLGAALFIWSGIGAPEVVRHPFSAYRLARFFGTISYSLYLWHWPLFTFARFSKDGLTLTGMDKVVLFALAVALSYATTVFIEQPFRRRQWASTRRAIFAGSAVASMSLIAVSIVGVTIRGTQSALDQRIAKLDAFNSFDQAAYRGGACFRLTDAPIDEEKCLTMAPGKLNVLLWGDSHAAHYYPGLAKLAEKKQFNLLQATQAGCAPSIKVHEKAAVWCHQFAAMFAPWLATHTPDIAILSGDWMGDVHSARFDTMIESIRNTVHSLTVRGIRVVLLGPAVQFKTGLPSMIIRAASKGIEPLPSEDMVRPDIFAGDAKMRAALPDTDLFSYISVIDAICPEERCPVTVENDAPLTWDYGHLTIEGSIYAVGKLPELLTSKQAASIPAVGNQHSSALQQPDDHPLKDGR
jgi:peptidoglycan/LPS O-acetylase OafA/YrhL